MLCFLSGDKTVASRVVAFCPTTAFTSEKQFLLGWGPSEGPPSHENGSLGQTLSEEKEAKVLPWETLS